MSFLATLDANAWQVFIHTLLLWMQINLISNHYRLYSFETHDSLRVV